MSEFNDRFAVVTGASSGIGLKLTETLLGHGATVLAMARRERPPESLHAHSGKRLHWLAGDVTRERDLDALASRAASIGPVDYLVPQRRHRPARRRPGQPGVRAAVAGQRRRGAEHLFRAQPANEQTGQRSLHRYLPQPSDLPRARRLHRFQGGPDRPGQDAGGGMGRKRRADQPRLPRPYRHPDMGITGPEQCPGGVCHPEHQPAPGRRQLPQPRGNRRRGDVPAVVEIRRALRPGVDRRQGLRAALRAADAGRRIATSGAFAVSCRDPTAAQLGGLDAPGPPRLSTHPEGLAA